MAHIDVAAAPLEIRIDDPFDLPAARRLSNDLILAGRVSVVVDFTHARDLHDDALSLFARALEFVGPRVTVRGLTRRHLTLLRYLGAPLPAPLRPAAADEA